MKTAYFLGCLILWVAITSDLSPARAQTTPPGWQKQKTTQEKKTTKPATKPAPVPSYTPAKKPAKPTTDVTKPSGTKKPDNTTKPCIQCNDTGCVAYLNDCEKCGKTGTVTCPQMIVNPDWIKDNPPTDPDSHGNFHNITCPVCNGSGKTSCNKCNGTGYYTTLGDCGPGGCGKTCAKCGSYPGKLPGAKPRAGKSTTSPSSGKPAAK
jgi:hypothetical protein